MSDFGQDLIQSLGEAVEHARGKKTAARVHTVGVPDVRAIRKQLNMSQQEFATAYTIPPVDAKGLGTGPQTTRRNGGGVSERDRAPARSNTKGTARITVRQTD